MDERDCNGQRPDIPKGGTGWHGGDMVKRIIAVMLIACAASASAVSLRDLVARISAAAPGAAALGGAVDLDGSAEYFTDNSATLLNGATSLTFTAWAMPRLADPSYDAVLMFRNDASTRWGITGSGVFTLPANRWFFNWLGTGLLSATNEYRLNQWTFLVATYEVGVSAKLYCNGVCYTNAVTTNGIVQSASVRIGFDTAAADRKWNGQLDDVGIFKNRALTSNDVAELFNNGVGKPLNSLSTGTNGLVRYWKLDDGLSNSSATQALDTVSGTYATGTAIGAGDWTNGIVPQ
jgi:hypothetical protein